MALTRRQFGAATLAAVSAIVSTSSVSAKESLSTSPSGKQPEPIPHDMSSMPDGWIKNEQIAILIYPAMTALDMVAPQYAFASLMGAKVHLVAKTRDLIVSDTGLSIMPTATFDECPQNLDVICIPGGSSGTLAVIKDDTTLDFVADRGGGAKYITSVCTGSLVLGAAGLLKGYRATSHWGARALLKEFGAEPVDERVVIDRNRLTGAGVTAGMDLGLTLVGQLRDDFYAQGVQLMAEYAPKPPYNAGTPATAPQPVYQMMESMFDGFVMDVSDAAKDIVSRRF